MYYLCDDLPVLYDLGTQIESFHADKLPGKRKSVSSFFIYLICLCFYAVVGGI